MGELDPKEDFNESSRSQYSQWIPIGQFGTYRLRHEYGHGRVVGGATGAESRTGWQCHGSRRRRRGDWCGRRRTHGAVVGNSMDAQEKRNREIIEARMGRAMAGAATKEDVIAMTQNHIDEALIINHVRAHGLAYPLTPADIIYLQQNGVSAQVIATMQATPPAQAVIVQQAPPPVVVDGGYYYGRPYYRRPYYW